MTSLFQETLVAFMKSPIKKGTLILLKSQIESITKIKISFFETQINFLKLILHDTNFELDIYFKNGNFITINLDGRIKKERYITFNLNHNNNQEIINEYSQYDEWKRIGAYGPYFFQKFYNQETAKYFFKLLPKKIKDDFEEIYFSGKIKFNFLTEKCINILYFKDEYKFYYPLLIDIHICRNQCKGMPPINEDMYEEEEEKIIMKRKISTKKRNYL